jgi:small subunit ribosomal protein S4e
MAHQNRNQVNKRLPLPRKGTKYVARALSHHTMAVPLVIAVRDMLKLAQTSREVNHLMKQDLLKINGKTPKNIRESIKLFGLLQADKTYQLSLLPTHKFTFVETKETTRPVKVVNKIARQNNKIQVNGHDGSNLLLDTKAASSIKTNDTLLLSLDNKLSKHIPLDKAKTGFVFAGKYAGQEGKIKTVEGKKVTLTFNDKEATLLAKQVLAR